MKKNLAEVLSPPDSSGVSESLFCRHLGLPECACLENYAQCVADTARRWYDENGIPWVHAVEVGIDRIEGASVLLEDGSGLNSDFVARVLTRVDAHALVVMAVSAGPEVDARIADLWNCDHGAEAMFLNAFAVAVTETLRAQTNDAVRRYYQEHQACVLPHYSPGYDGWQLMDQAVLFDLIQNDGPPDGLSLPGPLELLSSGMLRPLRSTLAVLGVTRRKNLDGQLNSIWSACSDNNQPAAWAEKKGTAWSFPERALQRWMQQRLKMCIADDGSVLVTFRFDGSTCTNMGMRLVFDYELKLKHGEDGEYRIVACSCRPAENDSGHRASCAWLKGPAWFMDQLDVDRPGVGQSLCQALARSGSLSGAACLCTRTDRTHKWQIVLQTLQYALERHGTDP